MKRNRTIPFLFFLMCLVAAMPYAWGQVGIEDAIVEPLASLEGAKIDALKVVVTLCHIPPDNPANAQTIVVGQAAVATHLAHGDYLGECHAACAGVPSAVPKTGQTGCWDQDGNPIDCAGTGQDGEYQTGVSVDPRFTDNGDGTVKDNLTGLIWLKDASCVPVNWTGALALANTLSNGSCGLTDGSVAGDWRVPNIRELQSLLDYSQIEPALPSGHPFTGVYSLVYWSSSTSAHGPQYAMTAFLADGEILYYPKDNYSYVLPVRGGQ
jgi:hypothetical protein